MEKVHSVQGSYYLSTVTDPVSINITEACYHRMETLSVPGVCREQCNHSYACARRESVFLIGTTRFIIGAAHVDSAFVSIEFTL